MPHIRKVRRLKGKALFFIEGEAQVSTCLCQKHKCQLHGYCESCRVYHNSKKQKPFCERESKNGLVEVR